MVVLNQFLGCQVEIPEDLRYSVKKGLWGRRTDASIVFGIPQPNLVLSGGIKDMDWLVEEGKAVAADEAVVFAITGKILYIDTPLAGSVQFNGAVRENPSLISEDPYGQGWIFLITPEGDAGACYQSLDPPEAYLDNLRNTEGFKNPEGIKGGVSGICKAVYTGIGSQKI